MTMEPINKKVLRNGMEMVEDLLADHEGAINAAYCKMGDTLPVKITMKLIPIDGGQVEVRCELSFRPEPDIKDQQVRLVNPYQRSLFEAEAGDDV